MPKEKFNALDEFLAAADRLLNEWEELGLNDYGLDKYPFDSSYDEVVADIWAWRDLFDEEKKVLQITKEDIQRVLTLAFEEGSLHWLNVSTDLKCEDVAEKVYNGEDVYLISAGETEYELRSYRFFDELRKFINYFPRRVFKKKEDGSLSLDLTSLNEDDADFILQNAIFDGVRYITSPILKVYRER